MSQYRCIRDLDFAYLTHDAPRLPSRSPTPAQYQGILYERKVLAYLDDIYGAFFLPQPWFYYKDLHAVKAHWCQPDGLLFLPRLGKLVLCEVKHRHTPDAYYQLFELYLPIVKYVFPSWSHCCLEIVRWFDPATKMPVRIHMCRDPEVVNSGVLGVHIWKPQD